MPFLDHGTSGSDSVDRVAGSDLRPVVHRVAGEDRLALRGILELGQPAVYVAMFAHGSDAMSCYVGSTGCGQKRPALGAHLGEPDLATEIFVITDARNGLAVRDVRVLERTLYAKLAEMMDWKMRCELPVAGPVGLLRFERLQLFSAAALVAIKQESWAFADVPAHRLVSSPARFGNVLYDYFQGAPVGEEIVLQKVGITAKGIWMGADKGVALLKGSEVRREIVPSVSRVIGARREELTHGGHLRRAPSGNYVVHRDLWFPTLTGAAKFTTGTPATAADWVLAGPPKDAPRIRLAR